MNSEAKCKAKFILSLTRQNDINEEHFKTFSKKDAKQRNKHSLRSYTNKRN